QPDSSDHLQGQDDDEITRRRPPADGEGVPAQARQLPYPHPRWLVRLAEDDNHKGSLTYAQADPPPRSTSAINIARTAVYASTRPARRNVTRVASCLPWAKPARAAGMRVVGSIWFVPIAARESASGVITSTWLPCFRRPSTWLARSAPGNLR